MFQLTETETRIHNAQKLNLKIPRVNQVTGDFQKPKKVQINYQAFVCVSCSYCIYNALMFFYYFFETTDIINFFHFYNYLIFCIYFY